MSLNTEKSAVLDREYAEMLRNLLRGTLTGSSLDEFILCSIVRTEKALRWISYHRHYTFNLTGIGPQDLAYDLVAELVSDDGPLPCAQFRSIMESLTDEQDTDASLVAAAESIIFQTVNRQLVRIFAEVDPVSARLLQVLRQYVRSSDELDALERIDGRWIFSPGSDALFEKPSCPVENLRKILRSSPNGRSSIRSILMHCLDYLNGQDEYRRSVLEYDVVRLSHEFVGREYALHAVAQVDDADQNAEFQVLLRLMFEVVESQRAWLEEKFLLKGTLTAEELDAFLA